MANINIDLLDICNELGGMKNAVEFINYYKNFSILRLERYCFPEFGIKFNILDFRTMVYKHPEISFKTPTLRIIDKHVGFVDREIVIADAYNYLRNNAYVNKIIIEFKDMDPDGKMVDMYMDLKKKNKEHKIKMFDVDPYGEEDWLEESCNDFNKKIIYEVERHISANVLKYSSLQFLNENFIGWCIFESESLERYIINVTFWRKNDIIKSLLEFGYTDIYDDNELCLNHGDSYIHSFNPRLGYCDVKKVKIKEKKHKRIYTKEDPYGEEDWLEEKTKSRMITKYKIFEELSNPFTDETPFVYSQHYTDNFQGFKDEFIADMKSKLVGKKIRIDGERQYGWRETTDPIDNIYTSDGKHIKPLYEITVKDIVFNGDHRQDTYYIDIIDDENKRYKLRKIVSDKTWANFVKKAGKELARIEEERLKKEKMKIKHFHHDPYGEEVWEEDD